MKEQLKILIVDDDAGDRAQIRRVLQRAEIACECVESATIAEAVAQPGPESFDLTFVDYRMPGMDGLNGIAALQDRMPGTPIVMATGFGDEVVAAEAMKRGAADYIPKERIQPEPIRRVVLSALERAALRRKIAQHQEELKRFASVLVHDLRSPLTSIRGFARLVEGAIGGGSSGKIDIARLCGAIGAAAERMNELISTLHDYTRVDAKTALAPVEMGQVLRETLVNLSQQIETRRAQVSSGDLPIVSGDAPLLGQLLQNLISNSLKYCEAEIPAIHLSAMRQDDMWLVVVKDNGIGIAQESCQIVFEPFKRLHDRSKYEGTGLGLATCKKIVERHGGKIWCESEVGNGTTFFFTLPNASTAPVSDACTEAA